MDGLPPIEWKKRSVCRAFLDALIWKMSCHITCAAIFFGPLCVLPHPRILRSYLSLLKSSAACAWLNRATYQDGMLLLLSIIPLDVITPTSLAKVVRVVILALYSPRPSSWQSFFLKRTSWGNVVKHIIWKIMLKGPYSKSSGPGKSQKNSFRIKLYIGEPGWGRSQVGWVKGVIRIG